MSVYFPIARDEVFVGSPPGPLSEWAQAEMTYTGTAARILNLPDLGANPRFVSIRKAQRMVKVPRDDGETDVFGVGVYLIIQVGAGAANHTFEFDDFVAWAALGRLEATVKVAVHGFDTGAPLQPEVGMGLPQFEACSGEFNRVKEQVDANPGRQRLAFLGREPRRDALDEELARQMVVYNVLSSVVQGQPFNTRDRDGQTVPPASP